jgi:hypothetical protein
MDSKEDLEQILVRDHIWIVRNAHHLSVSGSPGGDLLVAGVLNFPTGVARNRFNDAFEILERGFSAPKTPATEVGIMSLHKFSFLSEKMIYEI